ncbi:MAG: hypothetical protein VXY56_13955, partial [Pseudomonadota bacterium]|nr:hypothetical protein [Pseudomonadota bacterium]
TYVSLSKAVENVPEQITCLTEQGDMVTAHLINDEAESMIPPPINLIWLFLIFMGSCIFGLWSAKESWQDYSPLIDTEKNETFSSNNQAHGKSHFSLFQSKTFVEEVEKNIANQKTLNFSKNNLTP